MGTCAECQQNCAFIHGQHYPGPAVTSFFKIMICDEFMHTLYLPPQFAKATSHLADQEIYLEDSVGIKSKATVSKWENMLAIQQEWHQFSLNHNIERGDFLVFHYFTRPEDHFVVHIYGQSGCLKNDFDNTPIERSNKRARTVNNSPRPECKTNNNSNNDKAFIPCNLGGETEDINVNAANKESPATLGNGDYQPLALAYAPIIDEGHNKRKESCPPSMDVEEQNNPPSSFTMSKNELCCKFPSDENLKSQENEPMQLGVQGAIPSRLEMPTSKLLERKIIFLGERESVEHVQGKDNPVKNKSVTKSFMPHLMKMGPCASIVQPISQFSGAFGNDGKLKSQENEPVQLGLQGAISSRIEMPTNNLLERKIIFLGEIESTEHVQGKDNSVKNKPITESLMPCVIKMDPCTSSIQMPIAQSGGAFGNGEKAKLIKKEPEDLVAEGENLMNMTNMDCKSVKSEPVDAASTDLCLVLVDGREFIELPDSWPWKDRQQNKGIIFLTDPTKRVWPALLHRKQHISVLSSGWKEFSAANMLKPGDECVFHELKRCEYSVDIRRKAE